MVIEVADGGDAPLRPLVWLDTDGWNATEMPVAVSFPRGADRNYLSDFGGSPAPDYQIRCADLNTDGEVHLASGDLIGKASADGNHLCFQASDAYNNWVCYSVANAEPVLSFVQMHAD
jgi:hypothetical protein